MTNPTVLLKAGDILAYESDCLVLKYAQAFQGVDRMVARYLTGPSGAKNSTIAPKPGKHVLLPSKGQVGARNVLFVGVPGFSSFDYAEIRAFATASMKILAKELPEAQEVSMTMHGVGYGLDEKEAFLAQIGGLSVAFEGGNVPQELKRVTIIERDEARVKRLRRILQENVPPKFRTVTSKKKRVVSGKLKEAGVKTKPHVFVAMPFAKQMTDVYLYGIEKPVHSSGYLCERIDLSVFVGDILSRIKSKIDTAHLVIADLTGANANVYLEVGYAWAKEKPTLLVAKKGSKLKFDVSGQRCIIYESIFELEKSIKADLAQLRKELGSTKRGK
jgi:hypothetical protein